MSVTTAIEWCDHTFNPWIGCTPISAACDHCYAAAMMHRYRRARYEAGAPRVLTAPAYWHNLVVWNRNAAAIRERARVFPSLCDPFDAEVDPDWRAGFMTAVEKTPWLEWLLLTKRPKVARQFFDGRRVPDNVRLGISAEDKKMLALRTPDIVAATARAKLRPFLSAEPLLSALDMSQRIWLDCNIPEYGGPGHEFVEIIRSFGWVITGGESGPKARPSHPDWFRWLRDRCLPAGVPFFFKQWGDWLPRIDRDVADPDWRLDYNVAIGKPGSYQILNLAGGRGFHGERVHLMKRVGKKAAGATLDGREWREFPA